MASYVFLLLVSLIVSLSLGQEMKDITDQIKVESIDPSKLNFKSMEGGPSGFNINTIKNLFVKIYIREKHLKQKDLYEWSAELEDEFSQQEFKYENMSTKDETSSVQLMVNDPYAREMIKEHVVQMDYVLAVELNKSRFYGRYCNKKEKDAFKEL
jgi:hypothetical protein